MLRVEKGGGEEWGERRERKRDDAIGAHFLSIGPRVKRNRLCGGI